MTPNYHHYKALFEFTLAPFMQMLEARQASMDLRDWVRLVTSVQTGVTNSPQQYLGKDLPDPAVTTRIITEIFGTFIERKYPLVELDQWQAGRNEFY
jgi:hypothetical protein